MHGVVVVVLDEPGLVAVPVVIVAVVIVAVVIVAVVIVPATHQ
jgi:hypothetical protein